MIERGHLYLVKKSGSDDPKRQRVYVVVSRDIVVASRFSTVICAPVYSRFSGLSTQLCVGVEEGLKHESGVQCDELVSLPKSLLTHYVGRLGTAKLDDLRVALRSALSIECDE
jgi:mRNA interferase MazF